MNLPFDSNFYVNLLNLLNPPDVLKESNFGNGIPDWQFFHPQSGNFVQLLAKNSIYLLYNFFVLAGWAGTAKKICNYLGGNWRSHKTNCHCSEILFTFV